MIKDFARRGKKEIAKLYGHLIEEIKGKVIYPYLESAGIEVNQDDSDDPTKVHFHIEDTPVYIIFDAPNLHERGLYSTLPQAEELKFIIVEIQYGVSSGYKSAGYLFIDASLLGSEIYRLCQINLLANLLDRIEISLNVEKLKKEVEEADKKAREVMVDLDPLFRHFED